MVALQPALAGPPLVTDDTGIVEVGEWELILAGELLEYRDTTFAQFPVVDASYGLSSNLQVSAVVPWVSIDRETGPDVSDVGYAQLGLKWRFLARSDWSLAIAPRIEFVVAESSRRKGITETHSVFILPILFEYRWQAWQLNSQLEFVDDKNDETDFLYGLALTRPVAERLTVMFETYGSSNGGDLAYRVGMDMCLRESLHLLAGIGGPVGEQDGDEFDYDLYIGLQIFF